MDEENAIIHSWDIFPEYVKVMNEYLIHFTASKKYKQRDRDSKYLLINGFSTLTHVFKIMLNKSSISEASISEASISEASISEASISEASISEAVENTEKSIYYYTQFIEQMDENIMYDLNVSSNSASLFVYKKTINQLYPVVKEPADIIIKNVDCLLLLYKTIFDILFQGEYNALLPINIAIEICNNNSDEFLFRREMLSFMLFVNHFPHDEKISNSKIAEHIYFYIKNYKKKEITLERLCYKKTQLNYRDKLNEPPKNFIKWLMT